MNIQDIKLAFRNLKRNKLYSILTITGFSVGLSVSTFVALFVYQELTMDRCFPEYRNIVRMYEAEEHKAALDITISQELKTKYPEIKKTCPVEQINNFEITAKSETNFTRFEGLISTTNEFFQLFPVKIIAIAGKLPFEGKESILITQSMANILFPNENPLGKTITVFDFMKGQVSAVIEDFPQNSSIQAKILVYAENPDYRLSQNCNNGRCWNPYTHFLLLNSETDHLKLAQKLSDDLSRNHPEIKKIALEPLAEIYLFPKSEGENITGNLALVWILISVGMVIIVLSVINSLNFYITLQYTKLKEIGIKKVFGANLKSLFYFSFAEISITVSLSLLISLLLFFLLLPWANQFFGRDLDTALLLQPALLLSLLSVALLVTLICTIAPNIILSRFTTRTLLANAKSTNNWHTGKRLLTLVQFTTSIILMIFVLSLFHQLSFVKHANPGFEKEQLLHIRLPFSFKNQDAMKQTLAKVPFCEGITLSRGIPGKINLMLGETVSNEKSLMLQCIYADEDFIPTFGFRMKDGRNFMKSDMGTSCIMNEEAIRQYGWTSIDGKRFNSGREGGYQVIGVTNDFHVESLYSKISPVCIMAADNEKHNELSSISIRLSKGDTGKQIEELKKIWKTFIPDETMQFSFYDEQFDNMYRKDEQLGQSIGIVSFIAFFLTFMGILGQAFQSSLTRTKEIGIRKVNGATLIDILMEMSREFLGTIVLSILIAIPIARYLINRWLERFAYKDEIRWEIFASAILVMLVTIMVTVTWQTWKAATRNPVEALRYE